jgi:hypothetical protein
MLAERLTPCAPLVRQASRLLHGASSRVHGHPAHIDLYKLPAKWNTFEGETPAETGGTPAPLTPRRARSDAPYPVN